MADEGRLRDEMNRGSKAAEVLRNPVFDEAFSILQKRYIQAWVDTPADQIEERERLYQSVHVLQDIYDQLEAVMTTGAMASEELDANSVH
tara:strand:+ start:1182 stop:1451 length:270 start_codon:yes stop_codon:yes gene_type:complete